MGRQRAVAAIVAYPAVMQRRIVGNQRKAAATAGQGSVATSTKLTCEILHSGIHRVITGKKRLALSTMFAGSSSTSVPRLTTGAGITG
jgi:hypothetical protein